MAGFEMTIDELAARVGMTVRNVRAYATRGLIPAPRLVGRKGYYGPAHEARLELVRDLLDRGYTLNAVEKALEDNPTIPESHALDLLTLLTNPVGRPVEPETMTVAELTASAGVDHDEEFLDLLASRGLVERIDADTVRVLRPVLVKAGAQAMSLGMQRDRVIGIFDELSSGMASISHAFVDSFRDDVWDPFMVAGMPERQWPSIVESLESLLPVVIQGVLAAFRFELTRTIEEAIGEELQKLTGERLGALMSDQSLRERLDPTAD